MSSSWRSRKIAKIPFCLIFAVLLNFFLALGLISSSSENTFCMVAELPAKAEKTIHTPLVGLNGGMGNKLFEMSSLLGIARRLKRIPVINMIDDSKASPFVKHVLPTFPSLSTKIQFKHLSNTSYHEFNNNNGGCCRYDDPEKFINVTDENLRLKGSYFQSYKYFENIRHELREWLAPCASDLKAAELLLPKTKHEEFKVCVHIRRGDFKTDGMHEPTHPAFARIASDYLIEKYKKQKSNVTLVVLGNDVHFNHAVFEDRVENKKTVSNKTIEYKQRLVITYPPSSSNYSAFLIEGTPPAVDLAFSRRFCDVMLITAPSSTFGWWLAYLGKPTSTVYYRNIDETEDKVQAEMNQKDFFPPNWIRVGNGPKGEISESRY